MQPLSPQDTHRFTGLGHVDLAPDGRTAAFVEAVYDLDADETVWSVHVVPTDGSQRPRRLTHGRRDSVPRFSPDGSRLAFLTVGRELHVLEVASSVTTPVAVLPRGIEDYAWSPDGDGFALLGRPDYPDLPGRPPALTAEQRRRRYAERVIHVERFGYRGYSSFNDDEPTQVWYAALGTEPVQLTDAEFSCGSLGWTPDGWIAFTSSREIDFDQTPFARVWAVDRAGGEPAALTDQVNGLRGYAFTGDGRLAWIGLPTTDYSYGSHDPRLFVDGVDVTADLDRPTSRASEVQSLTLDYLSSTPGIVTGSDGHVYAHVVDAGCAHVYRYDGQTFARVIGGRRLVGDFREAAGTLVFSDTSVDAPVALRVATSDGADERLLHDPNPWLAEREPGEVRHMPVTLEDGFVMDAWAVLPAGHDGSTPLPAILDIHPGPHSSFPWDYRWDHRVLANAGYVVLSCNQPGSQGYGEEYSRVLDGRWGEVDLPGYLATVDEAVRLGLADDSRVGVTGATYGGFAALWCVAHSDRFKACVTNRAITDLHAFYADADIGASFLPAILGAEPWEDPALYTKLSPVTYVQQIKAPVRLLAFNGNGRTTVAASETVFLRLKKLGVETDMLVFPPGSATTLMPNRPWSKLAGQQAVQEWFDRWL
jgi:dipeptidyl aminopeptidase/acylaminoacyl peptidase